MEERSFSRLQRLGFVLEAFVVIPLGTFVSFLPWALRRPFGWAVGFVAYHMNRNGRVRAFRNLDIIFGKGGLRSREKREIVRRLFVGQATVLFEYLKIGGLTKENYSRFLTGENPESIVKALEEKKGVIVVTGHFGNWEYLGSIGAKFGKDIGAMIYRQWNPYTDRWLRRIRERKGRVKCFYSEIQAFRQVVAHLKRNGILAILADERDSFKPLWVPFFGVASATVPGPAKLHLLYGSPIVFASSIRQPDGRYRLSLDGPYHFLKGQDVKKACEDIMAWVNHRYEALITSYPDQWLMLLSPRWEPPIPRKKNLRDGG